MDPARHPSWLNTSMLVLNPIPTSPIHLSQAGLELDADPDSKVKPIDRKVQLPTATSSGFHKVDDCNVGETLKP